MNSQPTAFNWRCFENIPPGHEAACAAASCAFSLSTLQVASVPGTPGFALTERKEPGAWRWAVIGPVGFLLEEGFEPTQEGAKRAADEALRLSQSPSSGVSAT